MGAVDAWLLNHPDAVKHVLQDNNQNYTKGPLIGRVKALLGEGLLTSEGDFWRRQRRLAQPAFHRERIAGFARAMIRCATRTARSLGAAVERGEPIDVAGEMIALTLAIVGATLFGRDLDGEAAEAGRALARRAARCIAHRAMSFVALPMWLPTPTQPRVPRRRRDARPRRATTSSTPGARAATTATTCSACCCAARDEDDRRAHEPTAAPRRGHDVPARGPRDDGGRARVDVVPARAATRTPRRAAAPSSIAALGDRAPTLADLPRSALRAHGGRGGDAALSAGVGHRPRGDRRRPHRRVDDPAGRAREPVSRGSRTAIRAFWDDPDRFDPERFTPAASSARARASRTSRSAAARASASASSSR